MQEDEKFLENYVASEEVIISSTASVSEKAAAWRQQALLLQHLARNSTPSTQCELLRQHFAKLGKTGRNEYLEERAHAVEKLLNGAHPECHTATKINDAADEFPQLDDTLFEPACRGIYQSCQNDEISLAQLQLLKKNKAEIPAVPCKPTPGSNNACSMPPIQNRNTITNFLQTQQIPASNQNYYNNSNKKYEVEISEKSYSTTNAYNMPPTQNQACNQNSYNNSNSNAKNEAETNEKAYSATNAAYSNFRTAREEMAVQNLKKYGTQPASATNTGVSTAANTNTPLFSYSNTKKSLGSRRTAHSKFVSPVNNSCMNAVGAAAMTNSANSLSQSPPEETEPVDQRLINIDPKMVELISNEIMHKFKPVAWNNIAGLEYAKSIIKEAVVYPLLRPDIFTGLRRPPRGILLFGPPGTGKTLIGKCIASQSQSTFFSISASSLTSKWIGDGEKMVRALFAVAAVHQPAVVFIDEIDSLLSQRSETEHESSRRLKNEFLIQLDGATTSEEDRILIVGATNRPQELDEAARRRLVRRLYIPLPEQEARIHILTNLLSTVCNSLTPNELQEIAHLAVGYSGADMDTLCREASMEPIRSIPAEEIPNFRVDTVRPVNMQDFRSALQNVRPSVSESDLRQYTEWNKIYGAVR